MRSIICLMILITGQVFAANFSQSRVFVCESRSNERVEVDQIRTVHADTVEEENVQVAAFLFFDRCFPQQNTCLQVWNQVPNISVPLVKKSENEGFTTFVGESLRTQVAFTHTYTQKVTVEKTQSKNNQQSRYTISAVVFDEAGSEVIYSFGVSLKPPIDNFNTTIVTGARFDEPDTNSVIRPKFYLGPQFVHPPGSSSFH